MTSTKPHEQHTDTEEQTVIGRAASAVADVGAQVQAAAADATAVVADRAPDVLVASRDTAQRVLANLGGRSDASLALGTVFAAGLSTGMLLARAPRLLVAPAFLATLLLGGTLLGRGTTRGEKPPRESRP